MMKEDVIILAGGLGTRLRSEVSDVPKCMAPVAGRPFLKHLLDSLKQHSVERVMLSLGYLHEVVIDWLEKCQDEYPFEIDYVIEETPLGTGGGIRLALDTLVDKSHEGGPICILNGDTFYDVPLDDFCRKHDESGAPISIALKPMRNFNRYGTVDLAGNVIKAFKEKRPCKEGLINGGVYCLNRNRYLMAFLPEKFSFEREVLEPLSKNGMIRGFVYDTTFIDIGIPEDFHLAQTLLAGHPAGNPSVPSGTEIPEELLAECDTLMLDRDGVINVHLPGDYVRKWEMFRFNPGILEEIALWSKRFRHIFIVTNQRGVGKGLMTQADLDDIHARMLKAIEEAGGRIDRIYCCTAVDKSDPMRKPNPGMALQAVRDFPDVDLKRTLMIGDMPSDEEFAKNAGARFLLYKPKK